MATGAVKRWLQKIKSADSTHLNFMLATLGPAERAVLVAKLQALKQLLVEILHARFEMWSHLPYLLLGLGCLDVGLAKDCAKRCCAEWESSTDKAKVHRVAHRFFTNQAICKQLYDFADSSNRLSEYPELFV